MKILILGYSGYLGFEVYKKLINKNIFVKGIAKKNLLNSNNHINYNFIKKKNNVAKIIKSFDVIINCLGEVKNENLMQKTHIQEHKRIIHMVSFYAKKFKKKIHWIQISTLGVYGFDGCGPIYQKIDDKTKTNPLSLYEKTKLTSEIILKNFSHKYLKFTILRVGTVVSEVPRKTLFDKLVNLLIKKICVFVETKEVIFNIIHLEDLSNIILRCANNPKAFKKTYIVAINLKLKKIISFFENQNLFILKFGFKKKTLEIVFNFLNILKKKKIKSHKLNFFLYRRHVSMNSTLSDLNYKIKFNLLSILKERLE